MNDNVDATRPIEIDDLYRFRLVSDPQVSPDGATVAYVQTRLRKRKDDYAANIWLVSTDGTSAPRKFTASESRDTSPRWSPSGDEIAFVSTRSVKPQIWVIPTDGGEARRLTRMKHGVQEIEWSPTGEWLAFTAKVDDDATDAQTEQTSDDDAPDDSENVEPGNTGEEGLGQLVPGAGEWEDDDDREKGPAHKSDNDRKSSRVIERLHYKADGTGYLEHRSHLFVVRAAGGRPRQVTHGDWDAESPRWSPDGQWLSYLSNKESDADYRNIQDIFIANIKPDGAHRGTRRITRHDVAIRGYAWLPGGDGFCVLGHRRLDEAAYGTNVEVWSVGMNGTVTTLTQGWDRSASADLMTDLRSGVGPLRPRYNRDGSLVYFMAMRGGSVRLYSVPIAGGEPVEVLGDERMLLNFTLSNYGIAFAASSATHPNDIFWAALDGTSERQLTEVNLDVLTTLDVRESHDFWVEREDGTTLQGWYMLPPGYEEGKKYPALLQIHGGPHTAYGGGFFHEFQALAARGYVVIYTNPRGSQGYGQAFADAIRSDWGGIDYDDLMACLDHALELGFIDAERLGVGGGSYGGYMSGWIIGHTDRFKAAVASRMVSNLYSAWGSGDFTWMLWNWEMQGMPQEHTELYIERSPVQHVRNITTPLLITHAEDDLRCHIEQAEQMYVALKVLKKRVKLVLFPSGGHDVSRTGKPSIRVERLRQIADWYDEYLQS